MGSSAKPIVNKQIDAQTTGAINEAKNTITPWEQYAQDQFKKWTAWGDTHGDITTAPDMSKYLDIYGNANAMAAKQRVGDPTHAFTANLPGFNNQLQQQKEMEMYDTRAAGLHDAFQQAQAQGLGEGATASQLESNRINNYSNAMQQYGQAYYGRPMTQPLWQQIAGLAVGGLGAIGGGAGISALGRMGQRPAGGGWNGVS